MLWCQSVETRRSFRVLMEVGQQTALKGCRFVLIRAAVLPFPNHGHSTEACYTDFGGSLGLESASAMLVGIPN